MRIDIEDNTIEIWVDGQRVLYIGQVSDEKTINLFLYPEGDLVESIIHQEDPLSKCTHEILAKRREG